MLSATEKLRPQFFVTRQNGNMVPLIAMDELPPTVNIKDVSRSLTPYDIFGMTGVGTFSSRHRQHTVDSLANGSSSGRSSRPVSPGDRCLVSSSRAYVDGHQIESNGSSFASNGDLFRSSSDHMGCDGSLSNGIKQEISPTSLKAYGIQEQAPGTLKSPLPTPASPATPLRVDRNATREAGLSLPPWHDTTDLPLRPAPGVKEYCSYWLRHGECDYAQQGCLYRHEMPLDRVTLERLGLRDIPRWYREKHGLGSYLAGESTAGGFLATDEEKKSAMGGNWRDHSAEFLFEGIRKGPSIQPAPRTSKSTSSSAKVKPELLATTANGTRFPLLTKLPTTTSTLRKKPPIMTAQARQIASTLAALDAHEQRKKDRDLLAEKYTILQPMKKVNVAVETLSLPSSADATPLGSGSESPIPSHTKIDCEDRNDISEAGSTVTLESLLRSGADVDFDEFEAATLAKMAMEHPQAELLKEKGKWKESIRGNRQSTKARKRGNGGRCMEKANLK